MLWNQGGRIGHRVVVDSVQNGMVGIRDPTNATSYMMRVADFVRVWTLEAVYRRTR